MSFPSANAPVLAPVASNQDFPASFALAFGSPERSNDSFF